MRRFQRKNLWSARYFLCAIFVVIASIVVGCASTAVQNPSGVAPRRVDPSQPGLGEGTGVGSQDIQEVTDKMARRILGTPAIASASSPPVVAILPVTNDTRFNIKQQIFTLRIKALLTTQCGNKVLFAARDKIDAVERERDLKREGLVGSSGEKAIAGVDYFLTGELTGLSQVSSTGQSDYILYTFRLIDAESGIEQWNDFHEIKKESLADAIYR